MDRSKRIRSNRTEQITSIIVMGDSIAEKGEQSKAVKVHIESEIWVSQKSEKDPPPH